MTNDTAQGPLTGLTPHLTIHEGRGEEAIAFYQAAFGAELAMPPMRASGMPGCDGMPDMSGDTRIMHAHLRLNGVSLMLNDAFPEFAETGRHSQPGAPSPVTLHLQVDDADRWAERAVAAGATVTMPVDLAFWGDRYGQLRDPFGHSWSIGSTPAGDRNA